MTNQDAINELQSAIDLIKQDGKDWLDERDIPILKMAISALKAQEWIPCKEQPPDVAQRVLLSGHETVMVGMLHSFGKYSLEPTGISYVYPKDDIDAWKPLPEPYREDT